MLRTLCLLTRTYTQYTRKKLFFLFYADAIVLKVKNMNAKRISKCKILWVVAKTDSPVTQEYLLFIKNCKREKWQLFNYSPTSATILFSWINWYKYEIVYLWPFTRKHILYLISNFYMGCFWFFRMITYSHVTSILPCWDIDSFLFYYTHHKKMKRYENNNSFFFFLFRVFIPLLDVFFISSI